MTLRFVWLTACRVADAAPHAGKSTFADALTLPARLRAISSRHPLRGSNCPSCLDATRTRWRKTRGGIAAADFRLGTALGMVAGVRHVACRQSLLSHWPGGRISRSEAFEAVPTCVRGESARRLRASARLSAHAVNQRDPSGQRSGVAVRALSGTPRASRSEMRPPRAFSSCT